MSTATDEATRTALAAAAAAAGHRLDPAVDGDTLASVPGPFVAADLSSGADHGEKLFVAVLDGLDDGGEELLATLCSIVAPDREPVPADPVPSGAELRTHFDGPVEVTALSDGARVVALVVGPVERRGSAGDEPAPVATIPGATALPPNPNRRPVGGFDKLANVALDVSVELGRTRVTLAEVLSYDVGSVVELDRAAGAPVDVRVNGTLLAQGEVVLIDDEYAVRITAIMDPRGEV